MKLIYIILFSLITLSSYSQDNDDVYLTMYDADTIEQETTTNITNNYYYDYTSRINRFYRRPYYASYWSYHNPYWYSFHCYPFYVGYYWGYNPYIYYGWHSPYYYSYWYSNRPTYYYAHYDHNVYYTNHRKANIKKKPISRTSYKPTKTKPASIKHKPIEPTRVYNGYQKSPTKYQYKKPINRSTPVKNMPIYTKPRSSPNVVRNVVRTKPQRIQKTRATNIHRPR